MRRLMMAAALLGGCSDRGAKPADHGQGLVSPAVPGGEDRAPRKAKREKLACFPSVIGPFDGEIDEVKRLDASKLDGPALVMDVKMSVAGLRSREVKLTIVGSTPEGTIPIHTFKPDPKQPNRAPPGFTFWLELDDGPPDAIYRATSGTLIIEKSTETELVGHLADVTLVEHSSRHYGIARDETIADEEGRVFDGCTSRLSKLRFRLELPPVRKLEPLSP